MHAAFYVVLGHAIGAVILGSWYFRRYRVAPPPLGVFGAGDIAAIVGGVILVPFAYLLVPRWLAVALLAVAMLSVIHAIGEPVLAHRWAPGLVALALLCADLAAALRFGALSKPAIAINNVVLLVVAVGITNLWAQGGMKARDATALGGMLALYDVVATSLLSLTDDLFGRLIGLPLAPLVAWPLGDGRWLGLGLGDLLLATLFPIVARKAFGRTAGLSALALAVAAFATLLALVGSGAVQVTIPVMIVLGPLILLHYALCRRWHGAERTTWEYRRAELRPAM